MLMSIVCTETFEIQFDDIVNYWCKFLFKNSETSIKRVNKNDTYIFNVDISVPPWRKYFFVRR